MAYDYFESDEFKELLSLYQNAVREGSSFYLDVDDFISLSDFFVEKGDVNQAEDVLARAMDIHSESKSLKVAYAGVLICNYKFDDAKIIISDISVEDSYDVLYLQAQLSAAVDHEYEKCNQLFNQWIEFVDDEFEDEEELNLDEDVSPDDLSPDEFFDYSSRNRDARFRIIMSYAEFADNEAQVHYVKGWFEDYFKRFSNLGRFKEDYAIVEACYDFGLFDLIDSIIPELLNLNPYYEQGWSMLGFIQLSNGDYNEAMNSLQFALAINPDNQLANLSYAKCMFANQNYEKALEYLIKSAKPNHDVIQDYYIGKCYNKLGDVKMAIMYFTKVLEEYRQGNVNEANVSSYFDLAESFFACDKLEQAASILHQILKIIPEHYNSNMLMACIHLHNNELYEAIEIFTALIVSSNYNDEIITDVASRLLAYDYNAFAIFLLKTIIHKAATNGNYKAYALLAISFLKENRGKDCLHYLKILCDNAPDVTKIYFGKMIPESVLPTDYYEYLSLLLNNNTVSNN